MSDISEPISIDPELVDLIVGSITRSAIRAGAVDPAGKTTSEVRLEAAKLFRDQADEFGPNALIVDHTADVLAQARAFRSDSKWEYALVFYGTFLEHWANGFLLDDSDDHEAARLLLRRKSPIEKLRLSWRRGRHESLPNDLRDVAQLVFNRRNDFVHYKFPPEVGDTVPDPSGDRRREEDFFKQVETLVSALHEMENTYFFDGRAAEFDDRSARDRVPE